jgi:nitroreductase
MERSFTDVLRRRRSRRTLGVVSLEQVARIVREALKPDFLGHGDRQGRMLKAVLSAGALHSTKAIVVRRSHMPVIYDDSADRFVVVQPRNSQALETFLENCGTVLPEVDGYWVALIADCRNLRRLYSDHQSLAWRDAGAVVQTMALIAEAEGLGCCPLGILGGEVVEALLPASPDVEPVGVIALGALLPDQSAN